MIILSSGKNDRGHAQDVRFRMSFQILDLVIQTLVMHYIIGIHSCYEGGMALLQAEIEGVGYVRLRGGV